MTNDVQIEGRSEGNIRCDGRLTVGPAAHVHGNLQATEILIAGAVDGDVSAGVAIRLVASACVHGVLRAPRIAVESGARLSGRLCMPRRREPEGTLDDHGVAALIAD